VREKLVQILQVFDSIVDFLIPRLCSNPRNVKELGSGNSSIRYSQNSYSDLEMKLLKDCKFESEKFEETYQKNDRKVTGFHFFVIYVDYSSKFTHFYYNACLWESANCKWLSEREVKCHIYREMERASGGWTSKPTSKMNSLHLRERSLKNYKR